MSRTFDLLAEAALCAWEAMLELREQLPPLKHQWEQYGSVTMRHEAIALAPIICDVYDAVGSDWLEEHDLIPYDWEFVPTLIRLIDWKALPTAKELEAKLRAKYP